MPKATVRKCRVPNEVHWQEVGEVSSADTAMVNVWLIKQGQQLKPGTSMKRD